MTRKLLYVFLSGAVVCGCQQKELEQDFLSSDSKTFYATIDDSYSKTSLDADGNVLWKQGDQISVFDGSTINKQYQVTDASNGQTSAELNYVGSGYAAGTEIENNVAFYPYSSGNTISKTESTYKINYTLPETQTYAEGSFGNGSFSMAAVTSSTSDQNLVFKNVLGALKLQLKGNATITSINIKGNNDEILCDASEVEVSNGAAPSIALSDASAKIVTLNCGSGVALNTTTATEFTIALPPVVMSGGFTVTVTDSENKQMEIKTTKSKTIYRSTRLVMPEVNYVGTTNATDLSASGTANSYIVSSAGTYKFKTVKGNSSESVGSVASVEVLWESFGTDTTPSVGDLVNGVSYSSSYITFNATSNKGNAVIAAKDSNDTILWSWHIWLTDKPVDQVYNNSAGTMMDRNLGATSATPGDVHALGLLYQWGRKDPFLGGDGISSNTLAKSTYSWPSSVSSNSSNGTIAYAVSHPTTFITYNSSNGDWYYTGSSSTDNTRWQTSDKDKGLYDPCPPGYRVPDGGSTGVWSKAFGTSSSWKTSSNWDSTNKGMNFGATDKTLGTASTIWYPASGYLSSSDGSLWNVGNYGRYWSASPDGYYAYRLGFYGNGSVDPSNLNFRADGQSVRCIKEEKIL